jgi:TatD DNase family protein
MIFTDSHAHLSFVAHEKGEGVLAALLADYAAAAAGAERRDGAAPLILDPGTEPDDLPARAALLAPWAASGFLRLAAGIWPSPESLASPQASMDSLEVSIAASCAPADALRLAAIGEGGLDYHYAEGIEGDLKGRQAELFEAQLSLASRLGLPMIVHSRDAAADTLAILRSLKPSSPVLIHCFGYGPEEARALLDLGCFLSFAGNLTYKKSDALREACALVPADRLLLETDAPYMNPMPERGKPSSPVDVARTYACAALLRGVGAEELAATVSLNARKLFG